MSSRIVAGLSGTDSRRKAGAGGVVHMSEAIDPSGAGEGVTELRQSLGGAVLTPTDEGSMRRAAASTRWLTAGRP
jgi:hypothetical protein